MNKNRRANLIFPEIHSSLVKLENAYQDIGIGIGLYEAINDRLEKIIIIVNAKTQAPIKAITLEGKSQWQIIRDIVQEIPEEYGYETPNSFPKALREFVLKEMKEKNISETDIAKKNHLSLSFVSYTLSGRRKSELVMNTAATLLGYKSLDALIAASQGEGTMNSFKPYELSYYEANKQQTTSCVENFASIEELKERIEELKRIPDKTFVIADFPEEKEESAS
jgi:predicted Fe-Mo cluster-binding NifX family protein